MIFKNLSLIGFMGCGKSTTGKMLSADLNFLFIDTDKLIEYICELSVNEIFEKYGENYFRTLESDIIKKIYNNKNCIFACGGGVFINKENVNMIRNNSFVVYLSLSSEEAYKRLKYSNGRPLLKGKGESLEQNIAQIMKERLEIYNNNYDLKIDVNRKTPNSVKEEILSYLRNN